MTGLCDKVYVLSIFNNFVFHNAANWHGAKANQHDWAEAKCRSSPRWCHSLNGGFWAGNAAKVHKKAFADALFLTHETWEISIEKSWTLQLQMSSGCDKYVLIVHSCQSFVGWSWKAYLFRDNIISAWALSCSFNFSGNLRASCVDRTTDGSRFFVSLCIEFSYISTVDGERHPCFQPSGK